MNNIILTFNLQTVFGYTTNSDIFWTEICLTSWTSDGLGQIVSFLKLAPLVHRPNLKRSRSRSVTKGY